MKSAELENLVRVKLLQISYDGGLLADEIEETPDLPKQVCDLAQRIGPLVADTANLRNHQLNLTASSSSGATLS